MIRLGLALAAGGFAFAVGRQRRGTLRIVRVSRVVTELDRAEAFYRDGLGFERVAAGPVDPVIPVLLGVPGCTMDEVVMRLGGDEIALVRASPAGAPYPPGSRSDDLWFQHLAIVVSDMAAAYARLVAMGIEAISEGGPQHLPKRNGGVTAFKFRDPDGHPLELLHFPPGQGRAVWHQGAVGPFLGFDHSAIGVADTARSLRFYRSLGFRVAARSSNYGAAQDALDGLVPARAGITGLRPRAEQGPGLELLAYAPQGRPGSWVANDRVADWVTVEAGGPMRVRRDPDGHILLFSPR